ncbi:MAG: sigma-70 family RNA polymerase sigma factor [Clostridia bacterium]|nr:sigma-70 family RNA polymerase sigma factor [Clostridia bacterium]
MKNQDERKPKSDREIVDLFLGRDEKAVELTAEKYGRLFHRIASNITSDGMTADEVVNDTYLALWNGIPPANPRSLSASGAGVARNIALERGRSENAAKRRCTAVELDECIPDPDLPDPDDGRLTRLIEKFLSGCGKKNRVVFVMRYFEEEPLERIAERTGMTVSAVKACLHRTRNKLRQHLESEGYNK